jgi:hypothetical protein
VDSGISHTDECEAAFVACPRLVDCKYARYFVVGKRSIVAAAVTARGRSGASRAERSGTVSGDVGELELNLIAGDSEA